MNCASSARRALQWFFRDRQSGRLVFGQRPNVPLALASAATIGVLFSRKGSRTGQFSQILRRVMLELWALGEVQGGVNPARRIAGAITLAMLRLRR